MLLKMFKHLLVGTGFSNGPAKSNNMKKLLAGAVTALIVTSSAFAQSSDDKGSSNSLHFGIRGGLNLAAIVQDDDAPNFDTKMKPGFQAGVYLQLPITSGFSVQPEVLYSQKGYKADGTIFGTDYDFRVTTNYIDVPLLAKFTPIKNFGLVVGPQFSFLTNTTTKFSAGGSQIEDQIDNDNDNLRKNILGGLVGLEAGVTDNITLSARYALDFQKNNGDGTSNSLRYRNQVVSFTVGLQL
jgi:opacity protein-like surface antigen